jgi:hypothetical protein
LQQKLIDYNGTTLWYLFIRKKRLMGCLSCWKKPFWNGGLWKCM